MPSRCAARRIGSKPDWVMRALRRERGQDALAPRAPSPLQAKFLRRRLLGKAECLSSNPLLAHVERPMGGKASCLPSRRKARSGRHTVRQEESTPVGVPGRQDAFPPRARRRCRAGFLRRRLPGEGTVRFFQPVACLRRVPLGGRHLAFPRAARRVPGGTQCGKRKVRLSARREGKMPSPPGPVAVAGPSFSGAGFRGV